jgi:hypothetical protein
MTSKPTVQKILNGTLQSKEEHKCNHENMREKKISLEEYFSK